MKKSRKKIIILSIIIASILTIVLIYTNKNNIMDVNTHKNSSEAVELNEEYTKEDFIIGKKTYYYGNPIEVMSLLRLSSSGLKKLERNDYKLVIDNDILGYYEVIPDDFKNGIKKLNYLEIKGRRKRICDYAFTNLGLKEVHFENMWGAPELYGRSFPSDIEIHVAYKDLSLIHI